MSRTLASEKGDNKNEVAHHFLASRLKSQGEYVLRSPAQTNRSVCLYELVVRRKTLRVIVVPSDKDPIAKISHWLEFNI